MCEFGFVPTHKEQRGIIEIGLRIRKFREDQEISQAQLAFETGIPREQIGRIELAKINTSVGNILTICRVLDIHPKDLFDFEI